MLKTILIAAATAVAIGGAAVATAAPAAAGPAGYVETSGPGQWHGQKRWNGGQKQWHGRKSCEPIIRWRKVGYHHWRHWQPVVIGWDCDRHGGKHRGRHH